MRVCILELFPTQSLVEKSRSCCQHLLLSRAMIQYGTQANLCYLHPAPSYDWERTFAFLELFVIVIIAISRGDVGRDRDTPASW